MLRVGLLGASSIAARNHLLELGGVSADAVPALTLDERAVMLHDLSSARAVRSVLHLVVEVEHGDSRPHARRSATADVVLAGWHSDRELASMVGDLWRARLVPFEANLRTGKRAPRRRTPVLTRPDAAWPHDAKRLTDRLHATVGARALRIDHIGSTSVAGLEAKDLIDIQVTVPRLEDARWAADAAREAGFVHVSGEWFGEDRFGVEHPEEVAVDADPGRPTNINFRPVTAPVWREALLFRDWLRSHPDERTQYGTMKARLARPDGVHVDRYSEDKMPWIRDSLARAERWAAAIGWQP
jgi:dephospho-CoA kinase